MPPDESTTLLKETKMTSQEESFDEEFIIVNDYEYLSSVFHVATETITNNLCYFIEIKSRQYSVKYIELFQSILEILEPLQSAVNVVTEKCSEYDLQQCKGNGYRSIINIVESCLNKVISKSEAVQRNREKMFFQTNQAHAKLKAYEQVLHRLLSVVKFAIVIMNNSEQNSLFPKDSPETIDAVNGVLDDFNTLDRECFYGSCFGFQFDQSIRHGFRIILIAMAAYGDGFDRHNDVFSRAVSSVLNSGKYIMDSQLRAKRITDLTQIVDIKFCKAFWSLTDEYGAQYGPALVCPTMSVNLEFIIPPDEQIVETMDGTKMTVKLPLCVKSKQTGVQSRLLSYEKMESQIVHVLKRNDPYNHESSKRMRSKYLMLHCHGGGFVAQSSKSHEIYLRQWAKDLRFPILSIDYSLFPEACFPQALNEIFFAYCWVLNNCEKLGFTGEKIVVCGDSAGGNLVTALTLKLIMNNIRLPDSIVVAYPAYRAQYYPSASRILCLMDPLLPLGVLKACLQAYSGEFKADESSTSPLSSPSSSTSDLMRRKRKLKGKHSFSDTNIANTDKWSPIPTHRCADEEEYFSDDASSFFRRSNSRKSARSSSSRRSKRSKGKDGRRRISFRKNCLFPYLKFKSKEKKAESSLSDPYLLEGETADKASDGGVISNENATSQSHTSSVPMVNQSNSDSSKIDQSEVMTSLSQIQISDKVFLSENIFQPKPSSNNDNIDALCTSKSTAATENEDTEQAATILVQTSDFPETVPDPSLEPKIETTDSSSTGGGGGAPPQLPTITCGSEATFDSSNQSNDPLMSPIFASDELLLKMPPVSIFACALDPLFDDSIDFVRRLEKLERPGTAYVLDRLPHGFLNFQMFSPEAREACNRMVACIKTSLGIEKEKK